MHLLHLPGVGPDGWDTGRIGPDWVQRHVPAWGHRWEARPEGAGAPWHVGVGDAQPGQPLMESRQMFCWGMMGVSPLVLRCLHGQAGANMTVVVDPRSSLDILLSHRFPSPSSPLEPTALDSKLHCAHIGFLKFCPFFGLISTIFHCAGAQHVPISLGS